MSEKRSAFRGGAIRGVAFPKKHIPGEFSLAYPPDPSWNPALLDMGKRLFEETNIFRASVGSKPLVFLDTLLASAEWKSRHMATLDYMSHEDPAPPIARGPFDRVADNGYSGAAGENLCYGNGLQPHEAVGLFTGAGPGEGHYDNLVDPIWTCCGMGCAMDQFGSYFYTQDFGILPNSGPRPVITSISPLAGQIGSKVLIVGGNMANVTDVVFTNNKRAVFQATSGWVSALVPEGAVSGPIAVVNPGGFSSSVVFVIGSGPIPPPPPPGGTVLDQWKKQVWPLIKISSQYTNWAAKDSNHGDVALITKLMADPKATGTAKSAFGQALAADIRLAGSH